MEDNMLVKLHLKIECIQYLRNPFQRRWIMSIFIKEMVKSKLKQLTSEELLYYGKQYDFSLTENEAQKIVAYLKNHTVDPFNTHDQKKMFTALAEITDPGTANKADLLFKEIIQSYGLGHLFN